MINVFLTPLIAYLLGSISFTYITTRLVKGMDIRRLGDGNPGAANVTREVGIVPGLIVLAARRGAGSSSAEAVTNTFA